MINKITTAIILLICFLFTPSANCQIQNNIPDNLKQKFLKYTNSVPWEEIFLHTDREKYIAGEDLWFNIYLLDRQSFKPSLNSKIVYFELLNTENRPIIQKRFSLESGSGPGRIVLPDTLSTGIYTVRAYTSWMKNFAPGNCFLKDIKVYNALNTKLGKKILRESSFSRKGLNMGVSEKLGNSAVTLKTDNSKQDFLELFVNTDNNFRSENGDQFYIFIQTHGNINHISSERISGPATKIVVPRSVLSKGINQITIFDSRGQPVLERYIYTRGKENNYLALRSTDSCGLRNKITLDLALDKGLTSALNSTKLSISVAPLINEQETMNMDDYMVFGSEYGLINHETMLNRNIDETSSEAIDSILLNVRSNWINWPEILSGKLPEFQYLKEKEDNILSGKLLTNDQKTVHSSENLFLSIPGKMATFQYAKTDSEGKFNFHIPIDEDLKDLIIMPEDYDAGHKIIIESPFSDKYPKYALSVDSSAGQIIPLISKMSVNYQVQTIFGNHSAVIPIVTMAVPSVLQRFYGKPDIELFLSDYVRLPVMSEVFFELLPGVALRKKKSGYEFSITEHIDDGLVVTSPTLLIDGVIIKDASLIVTLDPEIVEKIDVIKGRYEVGKYIFNGIINVITRTADYSSVPLSDYMMRLHYKVVEQVLSFVSPDYSSDEKRDSRLPDYRNTLYWNPLVKPDKEGKSSLDFWSSDNKSDYIISIQGITPEGKIISLKKIIRVK
jgi:hypothetical protein